MNQPSWADITILAVVVAAILYLLWLKVKKDDLRKEAEEKKSKPRRHITYRVYRGEYLTALRVGWHRVNPIDLCRCISPGN